MAWFVSRRNCPSFLTANTVAGPLDRTHRSGTTSRNHQDPQGALLLPGRTAHPQGPASHPASAPGLALAEPVQQRSGETARPPTPFLTLMPTPEPPTRLPNRLAGPRQAGTSVSTAAICPADLPLRNHLRSSTTAVRGAHSPHPAESLRIKALQPLSRTSHPCLGQRDCIPSVDSGLEMLAAVPGTGRITVGADRSYDTRGFVGGCRNVKVTPHVAQKQRSAIDRRTTRHEGYRVSQRVRKRIEEVFD